MATIDLQRTTNGNHWWETLAGATSDVGEALPLPSGGAQVAVHVTGTFGGTLTMQGTIDGANWFTLIASPGGDPVTFTAAGYAEIATAVHAIRPSAGSGVSDVDVFVRVVGL
jgi:hypothetical protein